MTGEPISPPVVFSATYAFERSDDLINVVRNGTRQTQGFRVMLRGSLELRKQEGVCGFAAGEITGLRSG